MDEIVLLLAKSLVDNPEDVTVKETEENNNILIELKVHEEDMGKVIGKQGKIAKAIRNIVKAAAIKGNKKANVEIV